MDTRDISERISTVRQEIRDLEEMNARYRTRSEHNRTEKSDYLSRQLRLSQIKEDLAIMIKQLDYLRVST